MSARRRSTRSIGWLLSIIAANVVVVAASRAAEPAAAKPAAETQPTSGPTIEAAISKWFADLADGDADVREAARHELLGIDRRDLGVLEQVVKRNRPLLPSQAAPLRRIVQEIYLSGEEYDADNDTGFLGVRMDAVPVTILPSKRPPVAVEGNNPGIRLPLPFGDDPDGLFPPMGIVIFGRIPGYVGARNLYDGDIVLALANQPALQFGNGTPFTEAVRQTRPGHSVKLVVLRRGRLTTVSLRLDARPVAADQMGAMEVLDRQRREKAAAYWRKTFEPILVDEVG